MRHEVVAGVILVALACGASAHQSGQLDVSDLGDAGVLYWHTAPAGNLTMAADTG